RVRRPSTISRAAAADSRSSTSWMRSASTGVSEANSRASTTSMGSGIQGFPLFGSGWFVVRRSRRGRGVGQARGGLALLLDLDQSRRLVHADRIALDHDLAEEVGLPGPRLAEPHPL